MVGDTPPGAKKVADTGLDAGGAGNLASHLLLAGGAMLAGIVRLATYSGPPRPWRAVVLDVSVQFVVGIGVGQTAIGFGVNPHAAVGLAILSGVVGWEVVKQAATRRARKGK